MGILEGTEAGPIKPKEEKRRSLRGEKIAEGDFVYRANLGGEMVGGEPLISTLFVNGPIVGTIAFEKEVLQKAKKNEKS